MIEWNNRNITVRVGVSMKYNNNYNKIILLCYSPL